MLWSTADFGLLPTHEPVLSNELENLLLSMTSENASERPTAIDVLQVRTCISFDLDSYHFHNMTSTDLVIFHQVYISAFQTNCVAQSVGKLLTLAYAKRSYLSALWHSAQMSRL